MTHHVDVHVGKRVRHRRWLVGMTQQQLAEQVGIKFQQIQKYETGANRISASRLWDISDALDVPVSFFFEGMEAEAETADVDTAEAAVPSSVPADLMGDKEALDLVRSYYAIPENQRRRLFELARVLSDVA
ncbi:transcriptional regulator [Litorivita pollutaquae]|uniref:Transcriptional regulator n=1 Tax=Litorivita pollutaquae TaxID=2200892 RepID=A0A2V4NFY2_9RHOB|nr:helix-turn-helix transcriptional regulator [Litorivita pollutaquae]OUS20656.1 transcriptional regulator [Rhodobacterales bacterium 59_46_T64]PYC48910.1 transcriptional regulator [Litorivita pollutaquae]